MIDRPPDLRRSGRRAAVFLDVDGTLLELANHPDSVVVPPGLVGLLAGLKASLGGALALLSGRSLAALDTLLGEAKLDAAGCHGAEMRLAGKVHVIAGADDVVLMLGRRLVQMTEGVPLTMVEVKRHSIALHYRTHVLAGGTALDFAKRALEGRESQFRILPGKQVVEILPVGAGKGIAIDKFLTQAPYHGRLPVFAGDDVTDEEGFEEINRRQGVSVQVGTGGATRAQYRVPTTRALLEWLTVQFGPGL